jgi:5-methylcytosine-specific restriction endonuclease McrA
MSNFVFDNRDNLSQFNYIRKAGSGDYWFDIRVSKLTTYKENFGDEFCIILFGSENNDDSYVLPFSKIKDLFAYEYLYKDIRWIGSIVDDNLRIRRNKLVLSVAEYYNALEFLSDKEDEEKVIRDSITVNAAEKEIEYEHLAQQIEALNESYRNAQPRKRITISEQIARPNMISNYVKKLQNFKCQICNEEGFLQNNGKRYAEAHHIVELHKLIPGSFCSDNIIVVCANCHRKLHYANVSYISEYQGVISVFIMGTQYRFCRNIITKGKSKLTPALT